MNNLNGLLKQIELAGLWAYFHKDWLLQIRSELRPQLPPEYHLFVESEAILVSPYEAGGRPLLPDVAVGRSKSTDRTGALSPALGSAAVVEVEEAVEIQTTYSLLIRRAPENRIVAVLEILSPSNKGASGHFDEEKHLRKRDSLLEAGVQLLEIDALLHGHRQLPVPLSDKLSPFARLAWTAMHFDGRRVYRGWGWDEPELPPTIGWIVDGNLQVSVDLAATLRQADNFNSWSDLVASH